MARRSITSASVVPTTSDENTENLPGKATDDPVQIQEQVDQVIVAVQENQSTPVAATFSPSVPNNDELAAQQPMTGNPVKPHSPLPTSKSVHHHGHVNVKRVKNYRALANSFKHLQPFARDPDGNYPVKTICVLCSVFKPTSVFFPCQHMCVCNKCITSNDMSPDFSMNLERW